MKAISLFSGAGGLDLGFERAGIDAVVHVEINPHAQSVLRRQWPDTPIHADVETFSGDMYAAELVHGGSPCTDLSVAGRRAGLAGPESRLYWHQVRVWRESGAPWFVWENVAGALSSHRGADFAAVLWGVTGALPEVPPGGWRSMGFVVGPKGVAAWRLLDARWFGVPQRRRRVFVVGSAAGELGRCLAVLLDAASVSGDPAPCRASQSSVAALTAHGVGTSSESRSGKDRTKARLRGRTRSTSQRQYHHMLHTRGSDDLPALDCRLRHTFAYKVQGDASTSIVGEAGVSHTLGTNPIAVAYPLAVRGRADGAEMEMGEADTYNALRAGNGGSSRANGVLTPDLAVRRLTPIECERLMGWPDDWTRWGDHGDGTVEIADSHRYAMCGNGVVAPQAEWIGRRLTAVLAVSHPASMLR